MAGNEFISDNKALVKQVTLLKLENSEFTKSLEKLKGKQLLLKQNQIRAQRTEVSDTTRLGFFQIQHMVPY